MYANIGNGGWQSLAIDGASLLSTPLVQVSPAILHHEVDAPVDDAL